MPVMAGIGGSRTGIGANFARSRLLLAKRAGYLPQGTQISPENATEQWRLASKNLAKDARSAGFPNAMQFLRQSATAGGVRKPTAMRPPVDPNDSLVYAASRRAAAQAHRPEMALLAAYQGGPKRQPPNVMGMLKSLLMGPSTVQMGNRSVPLNRMQLPWAGGGAQAAQRFVGIPRVPARMAPAEQAVSRSGTLAQRIAASRRSPGPVQLTGGNRLPRRGF